MEQKEFSSTIQLYKLDGGVEMAVLTVDTDRHLSINSKTNEIILEGDVKDFEYSNPGVGNSVGVKIYPRKFSFYKNGYEILFYDQAMGNPDNTASTEHEHRKTEFLEILTRLGAYNGGSSQFLRLLLIGIVGTIVLTAVLVYVFSKA